MTFIAIPSSLGNASRVRRRARSARFVRSAAPGVRSNRISGLRSQLFQELSVSKRRRKLKTSKARKRLGKTQELQRAFLRNFNDRIRNPLHIIVGRSDLVMDLLPPGNPQIRESSQAIERAARQTETAYSNDYRLVSARGRLVVPVPATLKVFELVRDELLNIQLSAQEKGLTVTFEIEDQNLSVATSAIARLPLNERLLIPRDPNLTLRAYDRTA
jgi:signal transduction histidine kinase